MGSSFLPAFNCIVGICCVQMVWHYVFFPRSGFPVLVVMYPISVEAAVFSLVICYYMARNRALRLKVLK